MLAPPTRLTRARRRPRSRPPVPVSQAAISGCSGRIGCSAAAPRKAADVARVLGGVRPHLMVTDPPYGVDYDPPGATRRAVGHEANRQGANDDRADWREAWALFPGDVAYVWHGALHATTVADSLEAGGFAIRVADHLGEGAAGAQPRRLSLAARAVLVCGAREGARATGPATASRRRCGRSRAATRTPKTVHGTQKPVECMRRPMLNNSAPARRSTSRSAVGHHASSPPRATGRICLDRTRPRLRRRRGRALAGFTGKAAGSKGRQDFPEIAAERVADEHEAVLFMTEEASDTHAPQAHRAD